MATTKTRREQDDEFYATYQRHSRLVLAMSDEDADTLDAAARVLHTKLIPEILKHANCGENGNDICKLYNAELMTRFMQTDRLLRTVAQSYREALAETDDDDDVPDFIKDIAAQIMDDMGRGSRSGFASFDVTDAVHGDRNRSRRKPQA
jgi:hypothetical protein